MLAALTSTSAGEAFSYEAAECMGDAVLDYLAVLHLFFTLRWAGGWRDVGFVIMLQHNICTHTHTHTHTHTRLSL